MSESETYSFGEWLKQRREGLRLTQRELAALTYCSVPMIKKIESDERHPSPELAGLLADSLKIPQSERKIFIEVARGERPVDHLWQMRDDGSNSLIPFHVPTPLPRPATAFIGRENELKQLGERLDDPDCRVLTLVGPGGIGKTRLALAVALSQQSLFADGVAFIPLAAVTDTNLLPDMIARSLRLAMTAPPAELVMAYLQRRNMLIILDNCEQLQGDLIWLSELLGHASGLKLLVTSRERLHLSQEWVYTVPGLTQAVDLFAMTARRVKQDFSVEVEKESVAHICQLIENLPLAVELAAGWTSVMNCAQIADHIQRDINILATDVRNVPDRHRSIQAVFDHSWNLLSAAEQSAMMRLSVFSGGWAAEQSVSVAGADLLLLRRLVDKSLVPVAENNRYDLHQLIRQYATQKLAESGNETDVRQRHFDAYLILAAQLNTQQFGAQAMLAVARFDQEQDNIRAALDWSLTTDQGEAALDLITHLYFYWSRRGAYQESGKWLMRALEQTEVLESAHRSMTLSLASASMFIQGLYGEAESLAFRGMALARRLGDPVALISALGTYTFSSVNIEQALQGLLEGIDLIRQTGKLTEMLPFFYQGAATWFHSSGRNAEASDYYQRSIALFRQIGAVDLIADPLGRLGELALQEGRLHEAYELTIESMTAARASGYDMVFSAWGSVRLGLIQLYLGDVESAQHYLEEALLFFEDSQDLRVKQDALAIFSEVMLVRGDAKTAADHLQASLDLCEIFYRQLQATQKLSGTPDALPVDLASLCARAALVWAVQGQNERAVTLYSIAVSLSSQSGQAMLPPLEAKVDETISTIRSHLSPDAFNIAWEAGQKMSLSEAFLFLLS